MTSLDKFKTPKPQKVGGKGRGQTGVRQGQTGVRQTRQGVRQGQTKKSGSDKGSDRGQTRVRQNRSVRKNMQKA